MNEQQALAAKNWFIESFVEQPTTKNFIRMINNLVELSVGQRRNLQSYKTRNARYDFEFLQVNNVILIRPNKPAASWAEGVIWYDPKISNFRFQSGPVKLSAELRPPV